MFIFNFLIDEVMNDILDWIYVKIVGFFATFFSGMGNMGVEMFEMSWVQSVILFFSYLAWTLYVVGLVVAVFETAIHMQSGRGSIKDTGINAIKGFMAVSLFTTVPVKLYALSVELQQSLTQGLTGTGSSLGDLAGTIFNTSNDGINPSFFENYSNSMSTFASPIFTIFVVIMIGYAIVKVFFANIKRGGILLIQISVGSLYMFSVPRGYMDGFIMWCKQVIALCLTSFLQVTILTAGLMVIKENVLLGMGLMLSAGEVPRIAGAFGMDTSTKANVMGAVHAASMAVNVTKQVTSIIAK